MHNRAPHHISTELFAESLGIKPESIRVRLCRKGSYFGIVPTKLANGRLLWPANAVDRLTERKAG